MPSLIATIKSLRKSFTPAEGALAQYITDNTEEVPFLSVHELAELAGISVASISRFARTVGCASFREFKTRMGKESLSTFNNIYQAIGPKDSESDIIDKVNRN